MKSVNSPQLIFLLYLAFMFFAPFIFNPEFFPNQFSTHEVNPMVWSTKISFKSIFQPQKSIPSLDATNIFTQQYIFLHKLFCTTQIISFPKAKHHFSQQSKSQIIFLPLKPTSRTFQKKKKQLAHKQEISKTTSKN